MTARDKYVIAADAAPPIQRSELIRDSCTGGDEKLLSVCYLIGDLSCPKTFFAFAFRYKNATAFNETTRIRPSFEGRRLPNYSTHTFCDTT